jgi:hypothetical protein
VKTSPQQSRRESGVALVVTMIVVAVMAVVAAAFMQGAGSDRSAANSLVANYQARLAAEAGAQCAWNLVGRTLCSGGNPANTNTALGYHDAITVWQNIGGPASNEATVLYVRAKFSDPNAGARPGEFGPAVRILARPLVSGGSFVDASAVGTAMPFNTNDTNLMREMVNLNATNEFSPEPWIGYRTAPSEGTPVTAARWVYISRDGGQTNTTNPPIARYAYWVEDESFKLNVNTAINGPRGTSAGSGPGEATIDGTLSASPRLSTYVSATGELISDRSRLAPGGFPDLGSAALALGLQGETNLAAFRFLTTAHSAGLNLSRGGFKRFNINSVTSDTDTRRSLNRIIAAITNSNSVPNFGQRFYRMATNAAGVNNTSVVPADRQAIYLNKIAANFLDFIDADDNPTVINNDEGFTLRTGRPDFGIEPPGGGTEGTNPVAAAGVENLPRLQEYAIHGRIRELNPIGYDSGSPPADIVANYRISIDHYFEFWNPGTRDITINNAFLKIYDQPSFGVNITGPLAAEGRPFEIPLNGITFPAGRVTVLTTAPEDELNEELVALANRSNVVYLETDLKDRVFAGRTRDTSIGTSFNENGFDRYFRVSMNARTTGTTDYLSAMVLGNDSTILESFVGLPIAFTGGFVPALHFVASDADSAAVVGESEEVFAAGDLYYTRAASLLGNSSTTTAATPSSTEGDPRSLNEQLEFKIYTSGFTTDREQTRFFVTIPGNGQVPDNSSVGAPNTAGNYVRPTSWVDFSSLASGAQNAPLIVRNGSFQSIGELGHVTDPARVPGTSGALTNIVYSRGGGRTLRIGQTEHPRWFDGNQTNASRTWTSWRLADVFGVSSALSVPGLINPNGLLRDGGAALRAALYGMNMLPSPSGSTNTAGRPVNVNNVVNAALARMTNTPGALNPFWERGEISELSLFNTNTTLAGVNMQNSFDRGREEVVRRSIEMFTTRGSVYTAYVVGQALQATPLATNVTGSSRMKVTFEVEPQYAFATSDNFDPDPATTDTNNVQNRFSPPTSYEHRIISVSYD